MAKTLPLKKGQLPRNCPEWLAQYWTRQTGRVSVLGRWYTYYVVSKELSPAPPWFVGYDPHWHIPPFISEQVPAKWRRLMVAHDIYEYHRLRGHEGACVRALLFELPRAAHGNFREYVAFRVKTFAALAGYMTDPTHGDYYSPDRIANVKQALDYLEQLARVEKSVA